MTAEQIAAWHQRARDNLFARKTIISQQDILTEFARLACADAFEMAATVSQAYLGGSIIADSIRALAEREKET